jgi:hypothetical protein
VLLKVLGALSQTPKPIAELRSDLPAELAELVMQCLEKKPADRPDGAFELGQRLRSISIAEPWDNHRAKAWWIENVSKLGEEASGDSQSATLAMTISDTG